jgi:hypothetical protein
MEFTWILGKIFDFVIINFIPVFISARFVKKRIWANLACFFLSIIILFAVCAAYDFLFHDIQEMKRRMLKIPTQLLINLGLLNIIFGYIKKFYNKA